MKHEAWTARDEARIKQLRERSATGLTEDASAELRALRRRETIEATARRIAYFKQAKP